MLACFYNAALWGMFLSVLLFQDTWLEMRVNLGLVFSPWPSFSSRFRYLFVPCAGCAKTPSPHRSA